MGRHVLSADWMITMKLLSSVFTSTEVLSADICSISLFIGCLDLAQNRQGLGWGWGRGWRIPCDHQGTLPCDVILVAGQVIPRHLDSDRDRECSVIVGDGLWCRASLWHSVEFHMVEKKRKSFVLLYLRLPLPSSANQPYSKVCIHSYLFPFPVSHQTHNATQYDSAISKQHFYGDKCHMFVCDPTDNQITLLLSSL